jgi:hypothetical protein
MKTVHNKNYISIGVSVRTNNRTARNSGGAARQESNPQSPTAYSSVRYAPVLSLLETVSVFSQNFMTD